MNRKTLLFLLIFLLVINISIAARIDINLTKNKYGPQRSIEGELLVNASQLPNNTKIIIEVNGNKIEKDIDCGDIDNAEYSIIESNLQNPLMEFESAGTNLSYAIDINTRGQNQNPALDIQAGSYLTLEGLQKTSYPVSPSLDINADGVVEWDYLGPIIRRNDGKIEYIQIPPDYLFNLIPSNDRIYINGKETAKYCEKIKLPLARAYKIETFVKSLSSPGNLSAKILNAQGGIVYDSYHTSANCSIERTSSLSSSFAWKFCEIINEYPNGTFRFIQEKNKDYYVCVYSEGAYNDVHYYEIAFQDRTAINSGYVCTSSCTKSGDLDYFIIAYASNHTQIFDTTASISSIILKNSMGTCTNFVNYNNQIHCIFPLQFTSKSDGKINIKQALISVLINNVQPPFEIVSPFAKVSYFSPSYTCVNKEPYSLGGDPDEDDIDIKTPKDPGDYKLNIQLKYGETVYEPKSVDIKVISVPTIILNIPSQTSINMPITFNATVFGNSPFNYSWDFGDYNTSTEENPIHAYKSLDTFEVELTVTDKNGMSDTVNTSIEIVSVKDILNSTLDTTRKTFDEIKKQYDAATGALLDVISILKLKESVNDINFNLTSYEVEFKTTSGSATKSDAAQEQEYGATLQKLLDLRKSIPSKINVLSVTYDAKLNSYNEIPADLFGYSSDLISQKEAVFGLQNYLGVKSDSYSVDMDYLSGDKTSFRLVRKSATISIDSSNLSVVEYIPKTTANSIIDKQILTPGFSIVEADPIIKWPASASMQILYKLDAGSLDSLIDTRTFLFSGDIIKTEFAGEPVCGDGVCNVLEEGYCDIDCKPKYPWFFIVFIIALVIGGVYYINFYKGKWNFKELANLISVKLTNRRLFVSEQDKISLQNYIRSSLARGFSENQIISILLKKGWSRNQIDYIFRSIGKK